jgi:lipooligosaccharide transport system ATP-binding protein
VPRPAYHLEVRGLRKSYAQEDVVAGIDLALAPGECFGLLGPNGAGKTTTLRLCLGLTRPDAGEIQLLGVNVIADARRARARVGVVPQLDNLDPDFSVEENLLVYGRYFGMRDREIRARIPGLLEFSGLKTRAPARINTLSGGMKRRLTLARALVNDPDLIFLDEPTTGLDPQARHLIWGRLQQLLAEGKTIFLTTHFMEEAERLCNRIAILDHGSIVACGAPRELIGLHIEPQVVEVYGDGAARWGDEQGRVLSERCELSGDTVFCYAQDATRLVAALETRPDLRYLHRHANLEDVFLKLTGRELRD